MTLTITELGSIASDLNDLLAGGLIQEIKQQSRDSVVLNVFSGQRHFLFIKATPKFSRMHLTGEMPRADYRSPPGFMMKLRREIRGGHVVAVKQLYTDRVVGIFIKKGDAKYNLLFECSGHHPNIFLLDAGGKILAMIRKSLSYRRKLVVGGEYQKPIPVPQMETMKFRFMESGATLSAQIERFYKEIEEGERFRNEKARLLSAARGLIKHEETKLEKVKGDLKKAEEMTLRYGAAQKAKEELWKIPPGSREFAAVVDGAEVKIEFEEGLSVIENLDRIFTTHRRFKDNIGAIRARIEAVKKEVGRLALVEKRIASSANLEEIENIKREIFPRDGESPSEREKRPERKPYREFRGAGGFRILVGKGGRDNNELTFKIARDRDIWLHASGFAGAHVIIPREKDRDIPAETIRDAAVLAARHSKAKRDTLVDVIYTEKRYVKPVKGAEPGKVRVISSKTITV
ncbi:MAG: DUF814 domain-containing protein, partial [Deltaproteobacteria bacterium]|nr:DUF814 domain-containing protein [Deltaproteobacteria bacterium]